MVFQSDPWQPFVKAGMKANRPTIAAATVVVALLGAALAGFVAHASTKKTTITVKEKEYHLTLSSKKGVVGPVQFVIKNTGKISHAFAIAGPGVKTKKTKTIKPGKSATLVVTLKSGTYSVWCPVPGHAALGMKATVTVPGSAATVSAGGGGTPPATTTTDSGGGAAWG
jgi:uncharacterized cupredoxin-like copper-binding protein